MVGCFNSQIYFREEINGITIYNRTMNSYKFYEGLFLSEINNAISTDKSLLCISKFLTSKSKCINTNIDAKSPFSLCWLIEDSCNLNCIYCFANDKLYLPRNPKSLEETAEHILNLNFLTVSIGGGEPTLNSNLGNIISMLGSKVAIILDSNGTTNNWDELIPILKKSNVLVRITVDSIDNNILNKVRFIRDSSKNNFDQISLIKNNLEKLKSAGISLMVQTVLTQKNLNETEAIGDFLVAMGIKRWHLYRVNYSSKCHDIFEKIKVEEKDVIKNHETLQSRFEGKVFITHSMEKSENDYGANMRVFVNSNGEFFVDSIFNGLKFIGQNIKKPTNDEIFDALNIKRYKSYYLT